MNKNYIAVVGRPNVGKSTLVNRLAHTRKAIVHESPGVTRDRSYHETDWGGRALILIDTGGIESEASKSAFNKEIRNQAFAATQMADAILFVVDGKTGITAEDEAVAKILKRASKPVLLIVNKVDNPSREDLTYDFYPLGFKEILSVSALHGTGTGDLLDRLVELLSAEKTSAELKPIKDMGKIKDAVGSSTRSYELRVAVIGRPNVGKSSFINRIAGEERTIVSDVSGTTRDAIDLEVKHDAVTYRFVDTAGLRKKTKVSEDIEYYSYVRGLQAIGEADVCLLIIDASEGVGEQDQKIAQLALEKGAGLIVLLNKWDLLKGDETAREDCLASLGRRLGFAKFAPVLRISALSGRSVNKIWPLIEEVAKNRAQHIPTSKLNEFLKTIQETGYTITEGKAKLRFSYVTQTRTRPPVLTFFCNHPKIVADNFKRYLENRLRESFQLEGTPVGLKFRAKS